MRRRESQPASLWLGETVALLTKVRLVSYQAERLFKHDHHSTSDTFATRHQSLKDAIFDYLLLHYLIIKLFK